MSVVAAGRPAMADTNPRVVSALPDVKCTGCGVFVSLQQLSNHVCATERSNHHPPPLPSRKNSLKFNETITTPVQRTLSLSRTSTPSTTRSPSPAPSRLGPASPASGPSPRVSTDEPRSRSPSVSPRPMPSPVLPTDSPRSTLTPRGVSNIGRRSPSNTSNVESIRSRTPSVSAPDQVNVPQVVFPPFPLPDTKAGGQGGMAGVGRRAFQAAWTGTTSHNSQYLDVNSIYERTGTPPLSTPRSSPSPRIPDPRTPSPRVPSPSISISIPPAASPTRASPISQYSSLSSRPPPRSQPSGDSEGSSIGLAYNKEENHPVRAPASTIVPSVPSRDSVAFPSNRSRRSKTSDSSSSYISMTHPEDDRASLSGSSESYQKMKQRDTVVTASIYSTTSSNDANTLRYSKSMGAMGRGLPLHLMDTLVEEDMPTTTSPPTDSLSIAAVGAASAPPATVPHKIPSRSKTTPARTSQASTTRGKRVVKMCVHCQKKIEDGRWVATDQGSGSVLCEEDWKSMYLPKCRRCGLIIESHAVSSADGQLKGKYHRHCFNCSTCQKPFPDRSFYVFGGQPFCDYHYHQANKSLCCYPPCGNPIEGPCAEDHEGRRYHPDHLICSEPSCGERLEDYFEVDGSKYCEKHYLENHRDDLQTDESHNQSVPPLPPWPQARGSADLPGDPRKGEPPSPPKGDSRAMKRRTRLIDLDRAQKA